MKELTAGQGVDVIYDPVGGKVAEESLRCMNFGCRVLYIGFTGGEPVHVRSNLLLIKGASAIGFRAGEIGRRNPGLNEKSMATLLKLAGQGGCGRTSRTGSSGRTFRQRWRPSRIARSSAR